MAEQFKIKDRCYEVLTFEEAAARAQEKVDSHNTIIKLELETTGVWHVMWKDVTVYPFVIRSALLNCVGPVPE